VRGITFVLATLRNKFQRLRDVQKH
jgi:hypothetical protein